MSQRQCFPAFTMKSQVGPLITSAITPDPTKPWHLLCLWGSHWEMVVIGECVLWWKKPSLVIWELVGGGGRITEPLRCCTFKMCSTHWWGATAGEQSLLTSPVMTPWCSWPPPPFDYYSLCFPTLSQGVSLQPGVCHYGTILACCYGWRRSSKGVCEGTFVKPQTTQCSGGWPGSCSFSLWHHKLSPGCQWLSQSRDIVLTDTQGLSACEISSHSKYGWHHHPGYDVFVLGALFHQFSLLFS